MRKNFKMIFIVFIFILLISITSFAAPSRKKPFNLNNINYDSINYDEINNVKTILNTIDKKTLTTISKSSNTIDTTTINVDELINVYENLSRIVSNEELANFIKDNADTFENAGIDKSIISTSESLARKFDSDTIVDILKNDINLDKVTTMREKGANAEEIIISIMEDTPVQKLFGIALKLVFASFIYRLIFLLLILTAIYSIYITSLIFKKASKKGFASFIPIYRDIVHLKVCGMSPWLLVFILVPVIGWFILLSVAIIARFELSKHFGHGFFFGLGLLICPILFRSIIAFSNDKYIDDLYAGDKE